MKVVIRALQLSTGHPLCLELGSERGCCMLVLIDISYIIYN